MKHSLLRFGLLCLLVFTATLVTADLARAQVVIKERVELREQREETRPTLPADSSLAPVAFQAAASSTSEIVAPKSGPLQIFYGSAERHFTAIPDSAFITVLRNGEEMATDFVRSRLPDELKNVRYVYTCYGFQYVDQYLYRDPTTENSLVTLGQVEKGDTLTVAYTSDSGTYGGYITPVPDTTKAAWNADMGFYDSCLRTWGERVSVSLAILQGADIAADSDNDGDIDDQDEGPEYADGRVGALLPYNADDDNENGIPDYDDTGFVDDDLEPLKLRVNPEDAFDPKAGKVAKLSYLAGEDNVKIWEDASKTSAIASFPHEVPLSDLPLTYYVEGVRWDSVSTELRLSIEEGGSGEVISADTLRLYSGVLGVDLPSEIQAGDTTFASVTGLPDDAEVTLKVYKNGSSSGSSERTVDGLAATAPVVVSTSPGDAFHVEAVADQGNLVISSSTGLITPGLPASISTTLSKPSVVADENDSLEVEATVVDAYGNPVEDSTEVQFLIGDQLGGTEQTPFVETAGGVATATLKAPIARDFDLRLWASPTLGDSVFVPVTSLTGSLSSASDTLDIASSETESVTLSTNATDGTPVFWTVSNYAPGTPSTFSTTVSGGSSSVTLESAGARVGPAIVTATVGARIFTHEVYYTSSDPVSVEVEQPVLVGSITQNGTYTFSQTIDRPASLDEGPASKTYSEEVYQYGVSNVVLRGDSNTVYTVALSETADDFYVEFEGLDVSNQIVTDGEGEAVFQIRSRGNFDGTDADYLKEIAFSVSEALPPALAAPAVTSDARMEAEATGGDSAEGRIYLAKQTVWSYSVDAFAGFFGADPKTPAGLAGNVAGGVMIVGDIGSLVKNGWRACGFSSEEVNYVEVTLGGLGLATEVFLGVGEVADSGISGAKALVAYFGKTPFTDILVLFAKQSISNAQDFKHFSEFVLDIVSFGGYSKFANAVFTSKAAFSSGIRLSQDYGDDFAKSVDDLVRDETTEGISRAAGDALVALLDDIPGPAKEALKNADDSRDLLRGLGRVLDKTQVNSATLRQIFENDIFAPGAGNIVTAYTPADLARDLGTVVDALDETEEALSGFSRLAKSLHNSGTGRYGFRYELEVAAHLIRNEGVSSPIFVSRLVDNAAGKTDIDIIFDGVYYQVKRSRSAFGGGESGAKAIVDWVRKAEEAGAEKIRYVAPNGINTIAQTNRAAPRRQMQQLITDRRVDEVVSIDFK